nr:Asp-tRNA(Asn)/Glu-tRNA(Gln) amidotransferase subunit GatC [Desulfobacterales bacterium]
MKISKDEILYVARLARLSLTPEALDLFTRQLEEILTYMDKLNRVDTTGVPPTSHTIPISNAFREDEIKPSLPRKAVLANAPEAEKGNFIVPKIIT